MRRSLCEIEDNIMDKENQDNMNKKKNKKTGDKIKDSTKSTTRTTRGLYKIGRFFRNIGNTIHSITSIAVNTHSRRRRLTESNTPCNTPGGVTPQTRCRKVLGRTPAKLYSPFGIETPRSTIKPDYIYNPDTPEPDFSPKKKNLRFPSQPWNIVARRPRALFR